MTELYIVIYNDGTHSHIYDTYEGAVNNRMTFGGTIYQLVEK